MIRKSVKSYEVIEGTVVKVVDFALREFPSVRKTVSSTIPARQGKGRKTRMFVKEVTRLKVKLLGFDDRASTTFRWPHRRSGDRGKTSNKESSRKGKPE